MTSMNTDILEYLREANPWWSGRSFDRLAGRPRPDYVEPVFKAFSAREIKILYGIRRSGKSTIFYQLIQRLLRESVPATNIFFVNLESNLFGPLIEKANFLDRLLETLKTLTNPKGLIYLFLDEVQEVPKWEKWAHKIHELKLPVQMIASGSSSTLQSSDAGEMITGRNLSFEIRPLGFGEYLFFKTGKRPVKKNYADHAGERAECLHHFEKYLEEGGFPAVVLTEDPAIKEHLLKQYFQDILYRDIIRKAQIRSPIKLEGLGYFLISNIGRSLSYRKISATLNLAVETLKEYLALFEKAGLFLYLSPFSYSTKAKLKEPHQRKIYTADSGLRNACSLTHGRDSGYLVENLVFQSLRRHKILGYMEKPEIDFAHFDGGNHLVQVSYADELADREQQVFDKVKLKIQSRILITKSTFETRGRIQLIPAWYYLL